MAKHKVKRYDGEDGSDVTADTPDAMEQANQSENLDTEAGPRAMPSRPVSRTPVAAPRKVAARSDSNYSNEGRYKAAPDYSNEGRGSKAPLPSLRPSQADMQRAIDIGTGGGAEGAGIKGIAALAKGLANRGGASGMRTVTQAALEGPAATRALTNAPTRQIGYDKAGTLAKQRAARAEGRNSEMLSENARRSGVTPGSAGAEAMRKNLGGNDWSLGMKKGGKVKGYAAGGAIGSFRSSADGIAQRGKTRGQQFCSGGMAKGGKAR